MGYFESIGLEFGAGLNIERFASHLQKGSRLLHDIQRFGVYIALIKKMPCEKLCFQSIMSCRVRTCDTF
jgi:hypothetical protein